MATLQIEFKDKKFVSNNGVNVKVATDTHIEGNGWKGNVDENGNFYFIVREYHERVLHQLKFQIKNGYVKKILRIGQDAKPKVLKSYIIKDWPIDGVIGLSAGYIDTRNTYFRTADFQQFLDEYGITAVRCESANGIYNLMQRDDGHSIFLFEGIETDGKIEATSRDTKADKKTEGSPFDGDQMVEVTDASWVIKNVWKHGELNSRILYTLDDPQQIVGLPKLE